MAAAPVSGPWAWIRTLDGFRLESHITLVGFEWTSEYANLDSTMGAHFSVVSDPGEHDLAPRSQLHAYRCVARARH
jgi:hypothetical protein